MCIRFASFLIAAVLAATSLNTSAAELRVLSHSSFTVSEPLLVEFERQNDAKVSIIKAGSAGEMLNKLILTRANPIADVVFGIDNCLIGKALRAGVLAPVPLALAQNGQLTLPGAVSIDYGYVTLNYDKFWFAQRKLPLPKTLEDLTRPAYKNLLVMLNPATSSPGLAFMLSTIFAMGEEKAFAFWGRLRDNGLKVCKGWSEAYYTDFSKNGGGRPLVVSYASSPAAEAFYRKQTLTESPTGNLLLKGGVFRQVEGAALVKGGKERVLSEKFIAFLRSAAVQKELPTTIWMYPVMGRVPLDPAYRFAELPLTHDTFDSKTIAERSHQWVARWTRVVLRGGQ